jgi:hypothetical protein
LGHDRSPFVRQAEGEQQDCLCRGQHCSRSSYSKVDR